MNIAVVDDEKVIMGQISGLVRKQMPDCYLESYATGADCPKTRYNMTE